MIDAINQGPINSFCLEEISATQDRSAEFNDLLDEEDDDQANGKGKKPHLITSVKDVKGYTMLVEFDGSDTRTIDLSRLVNGRPSFRRLKDPKTFAAFEIR